MIALFPAEQPVGAALWQRALKAMDVILHIGAHRCATTSFQHYMRANKGPLSASGIGFWGPIRTRSGLFRGIQPGPHIPLGRDVAKRALGRVQLRCADTQRLGVHTLVVSDENMLGLMRANLRLAELYSGAGERMARFAEAFRDHLAEIVINIRSPETYWASVLGYYASKGRGVAHEGLVTRLADHPRSWRDVITDVARAVPDAHVRVLPFESFAGHPDAQLACLTGMPAPDASARERHNQTPDLPELRDLIAGGDRALPPGEGRWLPFTDTQSAILRERYADDLMWLTGGADGLAELIRDPSTHKAGRHLSQPDMTRGTHDERRYSQVARAGRERAARQAG